jgi:hypothetical protein
MTSELLASLCAVLLSLAASYLPGFSAWFSALESLPKRLVMLGLLAALSAACYGLACAGLLPLLVPQTGALEPGLSLTCDTPGALALLKAFLAALLANQATYQISKK